jgi:hypothetical protein
MKDEQTLGEARQHLRDHWEEGTPCPCCRQLVKQYKRKLNSAMAYGLILVSRAKADDGWVHIERYFKSLNIPSSIRGDMSKLKFWGLLEAKEGEREDGSTRLGFYRITDKGRQFVNGQISVQERVKLFNQKFYGFDGDEITIKQALGSKFDYNELMEAK